LLCHQDLCSSLALTFFLENRAAPPLMLFQSRAKSHVFIIKKTCFYRKKQKVSIIRNMFFTLTNHGSVLEQSTRAQRASHEDIIQKTVTRAINYKPQC